MSSSSERYARIHEILSGARSLQGESLEDYLDTECGADESISQDVRALLAAGRDDDCNDAFSEQKIAGARQAFEKLLDEKETKSPLPDKIGSYSIIRKLGQGGMGIVYHAEQNHPRRAVALKVLQAGLVREDTLKRFAQESHLLGLLQHPGIAAIYDAGSCDLGHGEMPYFAMELVEGPSLTQFAKDHSLDSQSRIALVAKICLAVHHAHERGVVHRDLKPANILVTKDDSGSHGPQPKILDFGIARSTDPDRQLSMLQTNTGQLLGTLPYMSPEQVSGRAASIDARADIYSLGVILYELLTDRLPLDLEGKSLTEVGRIIQDVDPLRLGKIRREYRGDLETICDKALSKEKELRYGSAAEFADDLQHLLSNEPISARPQTSWYQLNKFARRNRALVSGVATTLLMLVSGVIVSLFFMVQAEQSEAEAQLNLDKFEVKLAEFNQLAGVVKYDHAIAQQTSLYPAWPDKIASLSLWLEEECRPLLAMRGLMKNTVAELHDAVVDDVDSVSPVPQISIGQASASAKFLHDTLVDLLVKLAQLEENQKVEVERRLRWAQIIETLTFAHPQAASSWDAVREAISASERYHGVSIELRDQDILGLIPLGANPITGYQEFYHLRSAWDGESDPTEIVIPKHQPNGAIEVNEETGIVFVLLPGGKMEVDDAFTDPNNPIAHESSAAMEWTGSYEATIEPLFIARHELTQGQWKRLWTGNENLKMPCTYPAGKTVDKTFLINFTHPVESVNWEHCNLLLTQHGLAIPTGVQWEYGCRAGTTTPFFCPKDELVLHANLADQTAQNAETPWPCEDWDDGYIVHAPVGSFAANSFGLHDTHGNLYEWILKPVGDPIRRRYMGGHYAGAALMALSGRRVRTIPTFKNSNLGVRAVRSIRYPD